MSSRVLRPRLLLSLLKERDQLCHSSTLTTLYRPSQIPTIWKPLALALSTLPSYTELQMPALSPTMSQGNIASWSVKEGDEVAPGDVLAEIETDKATLSWENQDDGFVAKILLPAGTKDVAVGTTVAVLTESAEDIPKFAAFKPTAATTTSDAPVKEDEPAAAESPPSAASASHTAVSERVGPAARLLLEKSGLNLQQISPTGPHGIVTKGDVLAAIEAGMKPQAASAKPATETKSIPEAAPAPSSAKAGAPAAPATPTGKKEKFIDIPNSQIRKIIAARLLESKQTIPHLYLTADVELDQVNTIRADLKAAGKKVSVNDFIIRAVALALQEVPEANVYWSEKDGKPVSFSTVDVAVAVATDRGLVTPIVKNANLKSIFEISDDVRDLAGRARKNKLLPEEFMGGSFTISNLGMYNVDKFLAIINPPQACIMAVGGARDTVVLEKGGLVSTSQMTVTLSADHRVYDGNISSKFLDSFASHFKRPISLVA